MLFRSAPEQHEWLKHHISRSTQHYIYDGFVLFDEIIYSVVADNSIKDKDESEHFVREVQKTKPLIIMCRPPKDIIYNFGDREQLEQTIISRQQTLRNFDGMTRVFEDEGWNVLHYDYTTTVSNEMLDIALKKHLGR